MPPVDELPVLTAIVRRTVGGCKFKVSLHTAFFYGSNVSHIHNFLFLKIKKYASYFLGGFVP